MSVDFFGRLNDRSSEDLAPGLLAPNQINSMYDSFRARPPVAATTVAGTGTLTLNTGASTAGSNTTSGASTVSGGTLVIRNTSTSNTETTLTQSGTVGTVAVNAGILKVGSGSINIIPASFTVGTGQLVLGSLNSTFDSGVAAGTVLVTAAGFGNLTAITGSSTIALNALALNIRGGTLTFANNGIPLRLCRISAGASLVVIPVACGELNLVLERLSAGQTPQIALSGDEAAWNGSAIGLTVLPTVAIWPGTYSLIRFTDDAYLPADLGQTTFKSDGLPAQYTYTLVLNAANRTIDLVIADTLPVELTAADEPTAEPLAADQPT